MNVCWARGVVPGALGVAGGVGLYPEIILNGIKTWNGKSTENSKGNNSTESHATTYMVPHLRL
jgi:hypothetical protein